MDDGVPAPPLSAEAERDLAERYHRGDQEAGWLLVRAHMRFVFKVAHSFKGYGLRFDDLVQEGNVGLLEAVRRFEPDRGHRLISYAVHWIRAQMQAYIVQHHSIVRIGTSQVQRRLFYRLRREEEAVRRAGAEIAGADEGPDAGRTVTALVAERLAVSERSVTEMRKRLHSRDASLDTPVHDDADRRFAETLPSAGPSPETAFADAEVVAETRARVPGLLAAALDDRERYILDLRLFQDDPWTLEEIGRTLGITRERTRQLEARAKAKLRRSLADLAP